MLVDLVYTTTRDGIRLDGVYHAPARQASLPVDAFCVVHGTGSNFYGSTLLETLAERLAGLGCGALRVNTRGHDWLSIAATSSGGRRQGAAYEAVDDCRHDLAAWVGWLRQRAGPRVGLLGHSLGAVKCLYAAAREAELNVACVAAVSPPRLAYGRFRHLPDFSDAYQRAEQLCQVHEGGTLIEVKVPLPLVITAAGYVEKYGPDERYNLTRFASAVPCPALFTFGDHELSNPAFQGLPEELDKLRAPQQRWTIAVVPEADHFYTGKKDEVWQVLEQWLRTT